MKPLVQQRPMEQGLASDLTAKVHHQKITNNIEQHNVSFRF
jgi:hypothetical protein